MKTLKILREEDISMGFRSPDDARTVAILESAPWSIGTVKVMTVHILSLM